jgi:hypothetical protein
MTTDPRPSAHPWPAAEHPRLPGSLEPLASRLDTLGRARAAAPSGLPHALLAAVQARATAHRRRRRVGALLLAAACLAIAAAVAINASRPHATPPTPRPELVAGPGNAPEASPPGSLAAMRSSLSIGAITRANHGAGPDELRLPTLPGIGGTPEGARIPRWPDAHRSDSVWLEPLRPR